MLTQGLVQANQFRGNFTQMPQTKIINEEL